MRHQQQSASNFSHLVEAGTVPRGGAGAAVNVGVAAAVGVGVAAAAAAAGTVPDSQYETLAQGAAGCGLGKTITTEAECRAAHDALDLTIDPPWIGSHGGIPVGCSTRGYSRRMHWNSASSDRARSDMTPVCRVRAPYETLAQGAAGCGPGKTITTEAECRAAHDALDLTIDPPWIGSHGGIPVGCSTRGYS